jgi:hypothetical protein
VPDLVDQDVKEQLARGHRQSPVPNLERSDLVGDVYVEIGHELLQFPAHRGAVVEQRRRVVAGQPGRLRQRRVRQPVKDPPLGEEDVIDELADRRQPAAWLHDDVHGIRMRREPPPPLVAFRARVSQQFVEGQRERHIRWSRFGSRGFAVRNSAGRYAVWPVTAASGYRTAGPPTSGSRTANPGTANRDPANRGPRV